MLNHFRQYGRRQRDAVADASDLLMTALTQHGFFILASLVIGLITMSVAILILRRAG